MGRQDPELSAKLLGVIKLASWNNYVPVDAAEKATDADLDKLKFAERELWHVCEAIAVQMGNLPLGIERHKKLRAQYVKAHLAWAKGAHAYAAAVDEANLLKSSNAGEAPVSRTQLVDMRDAAWIEMNVLKNAFEGQRSVRSELNQGNQKYLDLQSKYNNAYLRWQHLCVQIGELDAASRNINAHQKEETTVSQINSDYQVEQAVRAEVTKALVAKRTAERLARIALVGDDTYEATTVITFVIQYAGNENDPHTFVARKGASSGLWSTTSSDRNGYFEQGCKARWEDLALAIASGVQSDPKVTVLVPKA